MSNRAPEAQAKTRPTRAKTAGLAGLIGPLLRLAAATAIGRSVRATTMEVTARLMLTLAAGLSAAVGLFCLSRVALILLERHMDAAEAWAIVGGAYGLAGGALYLLATRRRRAA